MKTEIKAITPTAAGLSLAVLSGPRGSVRDENWPCIEYTCQLSDSRKRVIWTGEYRLGVGHVKWPTLAQCESQYDSAVSMLTHDERAACRIKAQGRTLKKDAINAQLEAGAATAFAKAQKVAPKLDDVCHSLLTDGSAFFDGQRFEDWAGDMGYSDDSIKAKETFETCDKIGRDLSRALSRDELAGLREWAGNY